MTPIRRPSTAPLISIEVAPAYELLQSISIVSDHRDADTYEIGDAWLAEARARAGEDLLARLDAVAFGDGDTYIHLMGLAYDSPAPRDVASFLAHLRETDPDGDQAPPRPVLRPRRASRHLAIGHPRGRRRRRRRAGGVHPHLAPGVGAVDGLPAQRPRRRPGTWLKNELVETIGLWADRVWKPESLTILPILERDADAKRQLLSATCPWRRSSRPPRTAWSSPRARGSSAWS